jgi:hypothetical protein
MNKMKTIKVTLQKAKVMELTTMTSKQFSDALKKLGLTSSSERTAMLLGLRLRQVQRLDAGDADVPPPVSLLLMQYLKHGLPDE